MRLPRFQQAGNASLLTYRGFSFGGDNCVDTRCFTGDYDIADVADGRLSI